MATNLCFMHMQNAFTEYSMNIFRYFSYGSIMKYHGLHTAVHVAVFNICNL